MKTFSPKFEIVMNGGTISCSKKSKAERMKKLNARIVFWNDNIDVAETGLLVRPLAQVGR